MIENIAISVNLGVLIFVLIRWCKLTKCLQRHNAKISFFNPRATIYILYTIVLSVVFLWQFADVFYGYTINANYIIILLLVSILKSITLKG